MISKKMMEYILLSLFSFKCCKSTAEFVLFPGFDTSTNTNGTDSSEETHIVYDNTFIYQTTMKSEEMKNQTNSTAGNGTVAFTCHENEHPSNIGPYEVPTQQDLAIHLKSRLLAMFRSYNAKTLMFLNDIKEATRSTKEIATKCPSPNRETYKRCVRHVRNQCQLITKSIVTALEYQKQDVIAITKKTICTMTSMKTDPVELLKVLAMEEASLEFALPGFLRLLSACSSYCDVAPIEYEGPKPTRDIHMTDQDLVIKHFLTRKNYTQLIKGSY